MGENRVASVVVTYRRIHPLRTALRAILGQTHPPDAVYVVDNAGDDATDRMLRREFPQVEYLRLHDNLGSGAGLAKGLEAALAGGADRVWFHDDDSTPAPVALERSLRVLDSDPRIGLVGYVGGALRWGLPAWFRGQRQRIDDVDLFWADFLELDGALITADAARAVGFPRSDFFMMMENLEYSSRMARAGFRVACHAEDLIDRNHLGSAASSAPWRAYYQTRNHLVIALEHRSARELIGWGYRQLKFLVGALLRLDKKLERIRMRALGAWHGLRGEMGRTIEPTTAAVGADGSHRGGAG